MLFLLWKKKGGFPLISNGLLAWGGCVGESILWCASVRLRREDGNPVGFTYRWQFVGSMATAKTGSFYLTETVTIPSASAAGTRIQGSIDLGAYVSVAQSLAIAVESVDFIWQAGATLQQSPNGMITGNGALSCQLTDLNPGTGFVRADNQSLVASGAMAIDDANNIASHTADLYPDNFGPAALSEAFMVVNDSLYLQTGVDGSAAFAQIAVTARIRCRVVKLGTKDWMAIAIQSTASDN